MEASLPRAADVEAELQRIARQRADTDRRTRSRRSVRSSKHDQPALAGAFDSPEGFAFVADGSGHKR